MQPWYMDAVAQGRMADNPRMGKPTVAQVTFAEKGSLLATLSQAFYDTNAALKGVLRVDCNLDFLSSHLRNQNPNAASVIVEGQGEVLANSDMIVGDHTTSGGDRTTLRVSHICSYRMDPNQCD